ncbi:SufD family Fe-S cluster assembly protein [Sphingomonas sp.]|uniref:SufD family Fe-S cluster assembly protein n=1 Tax=Sphingomonas sp. TaxID=28214 RepID=UPI0025E8F369|nr:SufD family Fe-S cluster assembly protein [Sphingomonas sp.]
MTALPTRKDEAWRYSDLAEVARLWPVGPATEISVAAGERRAEHLIATAGIHDYTIEVAAGGRMDFHVLNADGVYGRIAVDVTLHDGAHFEFGGVQVGGDTQTLEIVTTVRHVEPNATSRQVVRSVLAGQATGSYLGKVAVSRDAQKTDSVQSVKAMLLDRTATANAKPELEIYADDVKCAHGATVGELDKGAMFYLASRGLPPVEARTLLLRAFVAEVFAGAGGRDELEAAALGALERLS